jgi:hypothetical protein
MVDFVVDTNSLIRTLLRYSKGRGLILFNMINNPIFKFHAQVFLVYEVDKFIQSLGKNINRHRNMIDADDELVKYIKRNNLVEPDKGNTMHIQKANKKKK